MKFLFRILDFVVASNVFVAISVASLACLSFLIYGAMDWHYIRFVFFATIFSYNFMRLVRINIIIKNDESSRHQLIFKYKTSLWLLSLLSLGLAIYYISNVNSSIVVYLIILAVISMLYALPVYKYRGRWLLLREIPFLKLFLIAVVWAFVTDGLPSIISRGELYYTHFIERVLFVAAITIPFDIRDLKYDSLSIATLPMVVGVRGAKAVAMVLMLVAEVIVFYEYWFVNSISLVSFLGVYLVYELTVFMIYKANENREERYFTVLIEALPMLLLLVFHLSKII